MKQNVYEYDYGMRRERSRRILTVTAVSLGIVVFLSLFLNFVLFPVLVRSDTMAGSVDRNSVVFVLPLDRSPSRGDIVYVDRLDGKTRSWWQRAVDSLVGFLTVQQVRPFSNSARMTGNSCFRRVLALPGDTIYMHDYILYVRPEGESHALTEFELSEKPYDPHVYSVPAGWDALGLSGEFGEIVLGKDEYFVLADNRVSGSDSRIWGAVPASGIKGRAVLEAFPFNRFSFL